MSEKNIDSSFGSSSSLGYADSEEVNAAQLIIDSEPATGAFDPIEMIAAKIIRESVAAIKEKGRSPIDVISQDPEVIQKLTNDIEAIYNMMHAAADLPIDERRGVHVDEHSVSQHDAARTISDMVVGMKENQGHVFNVLRPHGVEERMVFMHRVKKENIFTIATIIKESANDEVPSEVRIKQNIFGEDGSQSSTGLVIKDGEIAHANRARKSLKLGLSRYEEFSINDIRNDIKFTRQNLEAHSKSEKVPSELRKRTRAGLAARSIATLMH